MHPIRRRLPVWAATTLLLCCAWPALAQKPVWTPIAELLVGSLGSADPVRMSSVMTRCTALNMTLAGMATDISDDMSQFYKNAAARFIEHSVVIESRIAEDATGLEADVDAISVVLIDRVNGMLVDYDHWLDDNMATGGSYFSKDLEMEMDSCHLASKFAYQAMMH